MSSESIKYECPPTCPKVKKYLRAAIEEAPWLLDDIFPRKNDVYQQLPSDVTREAREIQEELIDVVYKKPIDYDEKIEVTPSKAIEDIIQVKHVQEIQEQVIIPIEKIADRDEEKIDLVEEEISIVQEQPVISIERIADRDEEKIELVEEEISIIQDEQPVISMERIADEEKIDLKDKLAERIVAEPVKKIPVKITEIVEEEIEPELEKLEEYSEAEKRMENGEEEGITDYEKFIDEELQEFLPVLIAKEIPEELRAMPREISRNAADLSEKIDRPTKPSREPEEARQAEGEEEEDEVISAKVKRISPRKPITVDVCDDTCPLVKEQKERIIRKLKERQRVVDHYRLTKGLSYFEDVCTCSLACMAYTLRRDPFARSVFASLALFAVGLKLCSELDAWEMPNRVS